MDKDLERRYLESEQEIQRLTALIDDLHRQLKLALDGNAELCALLKSLQVKLDELIAQTKKRNKREFGKKTEKHNPRPAATQPKPKSSSAESPSAKSKGSKHILENAEKLPHEPVHHSVKPEHIICPTCTVESGLVCQGQSSPDPRIDEGHQLQAKSLASTDWISQKSRHCGRL